MNEEKRLTPRQEERALMRAKGYVTVDEAAAHVHRHPSVLHRALNDDALKGARIGAAKYVLWRDLVRWINRSDPNVSKLLGLRPDRLPPETE